MEAPGEPSRLQRSLYVARERFVMSAALPSAPAPLTVFDLVVCIVHVSEPQRVVTARHGRARLVRSVWLMDETTASDTSGSSPRLGLVKVWYDENVSLRGLSQSILSAKVLLIEKRIYDHSFLFLFLFFFWGGSLRAASSCRVPVGRAISRVHGGSWRECVFDPIRDFCLDYTNVGDPAPSKEQARDMAGKVCFLFLIFYFSSL